MPIETAPVAPFTPDMTAVSTTLNQTFGYDEFPSPARGRDSQRAAQKRFACHHAHWQRQVTLLPDTGAAVPRHDGGCVAADFADGRSGDAAAGVGHNGRLPQQHPQPGRISTHRCPNPRGRGRFASTPRPETLVRPAILSLLAQVPVDCFTIDEAHCISEWGHDFRPEYRQLTDVRRRLPHAVCLAVTATATDRVRHDIKTSLGIADADEFYRQLRS